MKAMSETTHQNADQPLRNLSTFCVYPFNHINLQPNGMVSLCCRASSPITVNGRALSLHHDAFQDIWNSSYMRDVRARMVAGQPVAACSSCYQTENQGGVSLRAMVNQNGRRRLEEVYDECKATVMQQDAFVPSPISFHLWLGTLCNLRCRICSPHSSSQVAADPLHSRWAIGNMGLSRKVSLLPDFLNGAAYQGFAGLYTENGLACRFVDPARDAQITLPGTGDPIKKIHVSGINRADDPCTLLLKMGSEQVASRSLASPNWDVDFVFDPPLECGSEIRIGLHFQGQRCNIGLCSLSLVSDPPVGNAFPREFASRLEENPNWYDNDDLLLGEIFAEPDTVRDLSFAGGEPMLHKKLADVLDLFVARGLSKSISLYFSTNGTIKTPKMSRLLKEFGWVGIGVSIDGVGSLQEYIRPPSKWTKVRDNLLQYRDEGIAAVSGQPTPHVYNLYGLLDLVRFFDSHAITFMLNNVLYGPRYLSFDMLPQAMVDEVAAEWQTYRDEECRPEMRKEVDTLIGALMRPRPSNAEALQTQFARFTADMDKNRGQSLRSAAPRLHHRLVQEGILPY